MFAFEVNLEWASMLLIPLQTSGHYSTTEQATESADRKGQEGWKHTKKEHK